MTTSYIQLRTQIGYRSVMYNSLHSSSSRWIYWCKITYFLVIVGLRHGRGIKQRSTSFNRRLWCLLTLPSVGLRSIAMSVSVCLSVCSLAYLKNTTRLRTLRNFLSVLTAAAVRFTSDEKYMEPFWLRMATTDLLCSHLSVTCDCSYTFNQRDVQPSLSVRR